MLQVNLGDVVELVLIDEGYAYDVMHPFHLHGHSFYVVAMERHAEIPDHIGPAPGKYLHSPQKCLVRLGLYGVKWP